MASEIAMNYGIRYLSGHGNWSISELIEAAIQEASKPLVEAVESYAASLDNDDLTIKEAADIFMHMMEEAKKLRG